MSVHLRISIGSRPRWHDHNVRMCRFLHRNWYSGATQMLELLPDRGCSGTSIVSLMVVVCRWVNAVVFGPEHRAKDTNWSNCSPCCLHLVHINKVVQVVLQYVHRYKELTGKRSQSRECAATRPPRSRKFHPPCSESSLALPASAVASGVQWRPSSALRCRRSAQWSFARR
jgi:hypothetical protein